MFYLLSIIIVISQHTLIELKDVAGFLGYQFDNQINSGLMSVVFRERWELTTDDSLKASLIRYNRQDCEALKTICSFIIRSTALSTERRAVSGGTEEVVSTDSLCKVGDGNRPIFRKAEFVYPEFELVNKCAYFDYQRDRVFARTRQLPSRLSRRQVPITKRRRSLATTISQSAKQCAACGSRKIIGEKTFVRWMIDLKYYKTRIGVKKWQPRYVLGKYRCRKCQEVFTYPNVPIAATSPAIYGYGLMCWCVYHNIVAKQSMLSVQRGLQDIFDLNIPAFHMYRFRSN